MKKIFTLGSISLIVGITILTSGCGRTNQLDDTIAEPAKIQEIKTLFAKKYGKQTENISIDIKQEQDNYIMGRVTFKTKEALESGIFYAVKEEEWLIVFDGNGVVPCSDLEKYNFPEKMKEGCYTEPDEITKLLTELDVATNIDFEKIEDDEFTWYQKIADETTSSTLQGKTTRGKEFNSEQKKAINSFFTSKEFISDTDNTNDGTISGQIGLKKDNTVCIVNSKISGFNENNGSDIPENYKEDLEINCGKLDNTKKIKDPLLQENENLEVTKDNTFSITLEANATTGYTWEVEGESEYLKLLDKKYTATTSTEGLLGAGDTETFSFKALKLGKIEITFSYVRPWEEAEEPVKKKIYEITIK